MFIDFVLRQFFQRDFHGAGGGTAAFRFFLFLFLIPVADFALFADSLTAIHFVSIAPHKKSLVCVSVLHFRFLPWLSLVPAAFCPKILTFFLAWPALCMLLANLM